MLINLILTVTALQVLNLSNRGTFAGAKVEMPILALSNRNDISWRGRAHDDHLHTIIIAVKQLNLKRLEEFVDDISDPDSNRFGHGMSRAEIVDLTDHVKSCDKVIKYLKSLWHGKHYLLEKSEFGEYISGTILAILSLL